MTTLEAPAAVEATAKRLEDYPRYPLLFGPSPIQRLDRLTKHLGGATLWAKREDCNSPYAFGGNKARKLEYLVADALAQGCDTLVSIGGVQSNHTRMVAGAAAAAGLKAVLVQESWVDWPDVTYDRVGNILLSRLMGADVRLVKAGFGIGFKESWEQALAEVEAAGGKPYAIPAGASDHPLGGLGFRLVGARGRGPGARARRVLRHDHRLLGHGLDSGRHDRGLRGPAGRGAADLGIDASAKPAETRDQVARIARFTAEAIGLGRELRDDEVILDERYHAGHLRHPGRLDARRDAARRPPRGDDHRPGLRGQVDGRPDRPRQPRRDRPVIECPLCAPWRAARDQRLRARSLWMVPPPST